MSVTLLSKLFVLITIFSIQITSIVFAQKPRDIRNWEVGISWGASKFLNSINPNSDAEYNRFNYWNSDLNPSFSLSVIKNISSEFSIEFEYSTTRLSGTWNDNSGYAVPYSAISLGLPYPNPFKTGINEFDLMLSVNLNKVFMPKIKNDKWYLFIKGGGGGTLLEGHKALFPYSAAVNPFKNSLIYGAGFSYKINGKINLKLGFMFRRIDSDRLDGIHTLKTVAPYDPYFNIKEVYSSTFLGFTYALNGVRNKKTGYYNIRFPWFRPASKKYNGH